MLVKYLADSLSRLSLRVAATSTTISSAQTRCLHSTPCLLHKLDARAYPPSKFPSVRTGRWEPRKKMRDLYEYTVKRLPLDNTGGRGPNGRIWNYARAGGNKKYFRMVDWHRDRLVKPDKEILEERVLSLHYDPYRSAKLAMVGTGEDKRYIIATETMKVGDSVKTGKMHGKVAAKASEGDAFPLSCLPVGSQVNCVERFPGEGGRLACAAGTMATLLRKVGDQVVLRLPSKREISVKAECMATVGRVSNVDHNKIKFYKAGQKRWLGFKPRSGKWHRKDGRFGRKLKGAKAMKVYTEPVEKKYELTTLDGNMHHRFRYFHESVRGALMR